MGRYGKKNHGSLSEGKRGMSFITDKKNYRLLFIIILGVLLRLFPLWGFISRGIDHDDAFHVAFSSLLSYDRFPVYHGPLKFIIIYFFLFFGRGEFIIVLPPLLFSIAAIFLMYLTAKLFLNIEAALLSSFLLCVSLWHITYSVDLEMYNFYLFVSLLSLFCFYKSLSGSFIKLGLFILSSLLAFYTFPPLVTLVLAEFFWLFLFYRQDKKMINKFGVALILISIFAIPGLVKAYQGLLFKIEECRDCWAGNWKELYSLWGGVNELPPINIFIFILGLFVSFRFFEKKKIFLLLCLMLFPALFFIACTLLKINIAGRYLLFIYPFFIMICAPGISRVKSRLLSVLLICLFNSAGFLFLLSRVGYDVSAYVPNTYLERGNYSYKLVADYLKHNYEKGDAVIIELDVGILAVQYYLDKHNNSPVKIMLPSCGGAEYYKYDGQKVKNFFGLAEYQGTPERFKNIWKKYGRLWLIDVDEIQRFDKYGKIQKWIDVNYSQKMEFSNVIVYLFADEAKRNLIKDAAYTCREDICFLNCGEQNVQEINYPFQRD